jgi:DNA-binding IclR family transcriptional regulator
VGQVPAATRALRLLRYLAGQPDPVTLDRLASAVGLPRSTAYHLVNAMIEEGFVVHLPEEHRYGLGVAAFEVGSGYARQAPLQRIARRPLAALVDRVGHSAHLAVLHGRDVLYVLEERAPGRPSLVTDVGVRLPAQLTASGRAVLAHLPAAQVRALFPDRSAFVDRHGVGPGSLGALRALLSETRRRGYAVEEGEVTPGFASVAAVVLDHNEHPVAGVAVTYPVDAGVDLASTVEATRRTAAALTDRLGGRRAATLARASDVHDDAGTSVGTAPAEPGGAT